MPDPESVEEGTVLLEGSVGFALASCFCPMDVGFILAESGVAFWSNYNFRGLRGYVRLIKLDGKLVFQEANIQKAEVIPGTDEEERTDKGE